MPDAPELQSDSRSSSEGFGKPSEFSRILPNCSEYFGRPRNTSESSRRSSEVLIQEKQTELMAVKASLNRLTSIYVSQDIDRETFVSQKEELLSKKKQIQEVAWKFRSLSLVLRRLGPWSIQAVVFSKRRVNSHSHLRFNQVELAQAVKARAKKESPFSLKDSWLWARIPYQKN